MKIPKLTQIPGTSQSPDLFRWVNLYPQSHNPAVVLQPVVMESRDRKPSF